MVFPRSISPQEKTSAAKVCLFILVMLNRPLPSSCLPPPQSEFRLKITQASKSVPYDLEKEHGDPPFFFCLFGKSRSLPFCVVS